MKNCKIKDFVKTGNENEKIKRGLGVVKINIQIKFWKMKKLNYFFLFKYY